MDPLEPRMRNVNASVKIISKGEGACVVGGRKIVYYCVSCAKHRRYV
ncbi:MAG: hypothetical protein NWF14_06830 [Candidatus Bathyarchaeota archaeon]|nr:hypothetical protein [Candidatus Bathyarchaeota archaeon]